VLSVLSPAEVRRAIAEGDARVLTRAPGVGQRAASRIVTDLQGKIGPAADEMIEIASGPASAAVEALVGMGYPAPAAKRAVDGVAARGSLEDILRAALAALAEE
jgi:Holliday junction DNA helicase RuvA